MVKLSANGQFGYVINKRFRLCMVLQVKCRKSSFMSKRDYETISIMCSSLNRFDNEQARIAKNWQVK
jgi:hypothetical protein